MNIPRELAADAINASIHIIEKPTKLSKYQKKISKIYEFTLPYEQLNLSIDPKKFSITSFPFVLPYIPKNSVFKYIPSISDKTPDFRFVPVLHKLKTDSRMTVVESKLITKQPPFDGEVIRKRKRKNFYGKLPSIMLLKNRPKKKEKRVKRRRRNTNSESSSSSSESDGYNDGGGDDDDNDNANNNNNNNGGIDDDDNNNNEVQVINENTNNNNNGNNNNNDNNNGNNNNNDNGNNNIMENDHTYENDSVVDENQNNTTIAADDLYDPRMLNLQRDQIRQKLEKFGENVNAIDFRLIETDILKNNTYIKISTELAKEINREKLDSKEIVHDNLEFSLNYLADTFMKHKWLDRDSINKIFDHAYYDITINAFIFRIILYMYERKLTRDISSRIDEVKIIGLYDYLKRKIVEYLDQTPDDEVLPPPPPQQDPQFSQGS